MTLNDTQKALLTLLAQALWGNGGALVEADWEQVEKLAKDQGVLPMLYRGALKYKDIIPAERIRIWRGAMYAAVLQNAHMNQAQSEILEWLSEKGIRVAILKGSSVARYYNPPDMRCLGDIDLLINHDDLARTSKLLLEHGYKLVEDEHNFHVTFACDDVLVEVHHKASVVPTSKGGQAAAKLMSSFLENVVTVCLNDCCFPVLSETNQALMLLMHMERHVIEGGIGFRQLCDWAAFLSAQKNSTTMDDIARMFSECGLLTFAQVVTKACVRYFGMQSGYAAWCLLADDTLVDALMEDVFRGGNMGKADQQGDSELFTGRAMLNDKNQNAIKNLFQNLSKLAYRNFPITVRCKYLLPVFWFYLPMRYIVRSLFGLRKKKSVFRALNQSNRRFELHKRLHLYEVK